MGGRTKKEGGTYEKNIKYSRTVGGGLVHIQDPPPDGAGNDVGAFQVAVDGCVPDSFRNRDRCPFPAFPKINSERCRFII